MTFRSFALGIATLLLGVFVGYALIHSTTSANTPNANSGEQAGSVSADDLRLVLGDMKSRLDRLEADREAFIGAIAYFAAERVPSEGWLIADGSCYKIQDYPELFKRIGQTFTEMHTQPCPAAAEEFRLPDLRGVFIRGVDHGRGADPDRSNRRLGTLQDDAYEAHTHKVYYTLTLTQISGVTNASTLATYPSIRKAETTVAGVGSETRPINIALLPCIKY